MEIENIALQLTISLVENNKVAMATPTEKANNSLATFSDGMNAHNAQKVVNCYKYVLRELQKIAN